MKKTPLYIAWGILALSIAAWVGVVYFALFIEQTSADRVSQIQDSIQQSSQDVQAQAMHTILKDTTASRAQLTNLLNVNPASLSGIINAAGKSAGATIGISDALSDGSSDTSVVGDGSTPSNSFGFVVSAQGTFSSVVRVAELLEMLPVPSTVEGISFSRIQDTPGSPTNSAPWQVIIRVKVLTKPIQ